MKFTKAGSKEVDVLNEGGSDAEFGRIWDFVGSFEYISQSNHGDICTCMLVACYR